MTYPLTFRTLLVEPKEAPRFGCALLTGRLRVDDGWSRPLHGPASGLGHEMPFDFAVRAAFERRLRAEIGPPRCAWLPGIRHSVSHKATRFA
jgi:hypothetical protein